MYWLLDIIVVLLAVIAIICGYRRGILDMLATTLSVVILFALAIAGGAGFLLLFYKLNVVDNFAYILINGLGETNAIFNMFNMTSFDICQLLSALLLLILGVIISTIICVLIARLLRNVYDKLPDRGPVGVISSILGVLVYLVILFGVLLAVFAVINTLSANGNEFFYGFDEFLRSCTICGWLYEINPLNALFASLFA